MKYPNSIVEADHGKLKWLIKLALGFKSMKMDYATPEGLDVPHTLRLGGPVETQTAAYRGLALATESYVKSTP